MADRQAWFLTQQGQPLQLQTGPLPEPGVGEVRVRVAGCGMCHTDVGFFQGPVKTNKPLPLVLGHEIAGVVEQAGASAESWRGKSVIVPAVIPCGECVYCKSGKSTLCRKQKMPGNDIDGGFASHLVVPAHALCEVAANSPVPLAHLSVVADAVTTPFQALKRSGLAANDVAVFIGAGGVGGFGVQLASAMGAHVVAVDVSEDRLKLMTTFGAKLTLNPKTSDPKQIKTAIQGFVKECQANPLEWKILETSGTPQGQELAFSLLTYGSTLSVVGFTMEKLQLRLSNLMAYDARAIGNWGCPAELYPEALSYVLNGKVKVTPLIEEFPLSKINDVMNLAVGHKLTKRPVLIP